MSTNSVNEGAEKPPHHRFFGELKRQIWLLFSVSMASIFVISIDWFSKSMLQLIFGASFQDRLLIRNYELSLSLNESGIWGIPISPFALSCAFVVAFILIWIVRAYDNQDARSRSLQRTRLKREFGNEPIKWYRKGLILALIVSFGISLGWVSAGLEYVLIGSLESITEIPDRFTWCLSILLFLALSVAAQRKLTSRASVKGQAVLISLVFLSPLVFLIPADAVLRMTILLAFLALIWGYLFLSEIQFHATPNNFSHARNPLRHKYLVFFVSQNAAPSLVDNGYLAGDFRDAVLGRLGSDAPEDLVFALNAVFERWQAVDETLTSKRIIGSNLADFSVSEMSHFFQRLKQAESLSGTETQLREIIGNSVTEALNGKAIEGPPVRASIASNLLMLQLLSTLLRHYVPELGKEVPLSDLVKYLQLRMNTKFNWLMPIMSVEFHSGHIGNIDAGPTRLERAIFIFSRTMGDFDGSVVTAKWFAWLIEDVFRGYYNTSEEDMSFEFFDSNADHSCTLNMKHLWSGECGLEESSAIDFESFDECREAIRKIVEFQIGRDQEEIVIDFTGGQKPTSMAAVLATTSSAVTSQYIGTNNYEFSSFDLRYHDIWALLS